MARKYTMAQLVRALGKLGFDIEGVVAEMEKEEELPTGPGGNVDYVEFGSEAHAGLLGLELVNGKTPEGVVTVTDGEGRKWKLADPIYDAMNTSLTLSPNEVRLIHGRVLAQRTNELNSPIPVPQSKDPRAANFAPTLWNPETKRPFRVTTEVD